MTENKFVADFSELGSGDVARVGGKNASLAEMITHLEPVGIRVPDPAPGLLSPALLGDHSDRRDRRLRSDCRLPPASAGRM